MSGHVPENLVLFLKDKYGVQTFIETGTYKGESSRWAAQHFDSVYTIEQFERYFVGAKRGAEGIQNLYMILGDSREKLVDVLEEIDGHAIIWLDAHWIGNAEAAHEQMNECPLAEELDAVLMSPFEHFIIVDDARLFIDGPKKPHDPKQWPTYAEIEERLDGWKLFVKNDIIIAIPEEFAPKVGTFIEGEDIR